MIWEKSSRQHEEQFHKGPELGTCLCDSSVVRTLVWLQQSEWEEKWEMRNYSFQINNEKLSVHLCLTCCPLPLPILHKCLLSVFGCKKPGHRE